MINNWDSYWGKAANRNFWLEPDKAVVELKETLDSYGIKDILDLGCGIGRHSLYFADFGFNVTAMDSSSEALAILRQLSIEKGAPVKVIQGDYSQDLFPEESFGLVLSFNVLYHGFRDQFHGAVRLIHKWLKPGGLLFFTCPTRRDAKYGNGEQLSPNTYKPLNSVHPSDIHYFADEADIQDFLCQYREISKTIFEHYWDNKGTKQFSSSWHILARK